MEPKNYLRAFIYLCLAQALVAANIVTAKYALAYIPPLVYVSLRYIIAFLFSLLIFLKSFNFRELHPKTLISFNLPLLMIQVISGGFLFNIFMAYGLQYTDAGIAGIITSLLPIMTILFAWIFYKTRLSKKNLFSIALSFLGLLCISGQGFFQQHEHHTLLGDFLVFLALIPEALYYILSHKYKPAISLQLNACINFGINSLLFLVLTYVELNQIPVIPIHVLLLVIFQGFSLSIYYFIWLKACRIANEIQISISAAFMPITTLFLAVLLLHEQPNKIQIIGIMVILATIIFLREKDA